MERDAEQAIIQQARLKTVTRYPLRLRLKTAAIATLVTSLFWICFMVLYWPRQPSAPAAAASPIAAPRSYDAPAGGLRIPVQGVTANQLIDTFTQSREGGARGHDAIDIMAPRGTLVIAAAAGKVEKLFLSKNGGTTLYERSPDGRTVYYYAHLDGYAPGVVEGMIVASGQALGFVGSSGDADPGAPHLHFAIMALAPGEHWWQGRPINPYPLLGGR